MATKNIGILLLLGLIFGSVEVNQSFAQPSFELPEGYITKDLNTEDGRNIINIFATLTIIFGLIIIALTRNKTIEEFFSKKITIVSFIVIIISAILSFYIFQNEEFQNYIDHTNIQNILVAVEKTDYFTVLVSFVLISLIAAGISYSYFKKINKVSGLSTSITYVLKVSVFMFLIVVINSAWFAVNLIVSSIVSSIAGPLKIVTIANQFNTIFDATNSSIILVLSGFGQFWWVVISTLFMIFSIYELTKKQPNKISILMAIIGIIIFVFLGLLPTYYSIIATSEENIKNIFYWTSIISIFIFTIFSTLGYADSIKEGVEKIKKETKGKAKSAFVKTFSIIRLIINLIGIGRGILLVLLPISLIGFSIETSPANQIFIKMFDTIAKNFSDGQTGALFFFVTFNIYFGSYMIYDFYMYFKGMKNKFIDKKNPVFKAIVTKVGMISAVMFFAIVFVFAAQQSWYDLTTVPNEIKSESPEWVQQKLDLKTQKIQFGFTEFVIGIISLMTVSTLVLKKFKK